MLLIIIADIKSAMDSKNIATAINRKENPKIMPPIPINFLFETDGTQSKTGCTGSYSNA